MTDERVKRTPPYRTGPYRAFSRRECPSEAGAHWADAQNTNSVIGDAVGSAYSVAAEQLLEGRDAAARIRDGSYNTADLEDDVGRLIRRIARVTKDSSVAWLDILSAVLRMAAPPTYGGPKPSDRASTPISIEVVSSRPTEVVVDINASTPGFSPIVHGIHAIPPAEGVLKDVVFKLSNDRKRAVLAIRVPDKASPGSYAGLIVDRMTNEPGGTVRVHISANG